MLIDFRDGGGEWEGGGEGREEKGRRGIWISCLPVGAPTGH